MIASPPPAPPAHPFHTVLIVDDSPMDRHLAGAIVQKMSGWQPAFAGDGTEALGWLAQQSPAVVLTDMLMPGMDGLQLVQQIRSRHPTVPVILMTAHGSEDIAIQALHKGAASYVPKKSLQRDLSETLEQVVAASQTRVREQRVLDRLRYTETHYVLENDTSLIPPLVSAIEEDLTRLKLVEPSSLVLLGVALHEALTNAILHGNLELSSSLRETDEKEYHHLSISRRSLLPYASRRVYVTIRYAREALTFTIRDEGAGFDPATLPDPTDPANLGKVSGRGLLLIQTFMDRVEHNATGNLITMTKLGSPQ